MRYTLPVALLFALLLSACVSTDITSVGGDTSDLEPIPPSQVRLYSDKSSAECTYDEIAVIQASSLSAMVSTSKLSEKAKEAAGERGANAVVMRNVNESSDPGGRNGEFLAIHEERPCN